MNSNLNNEEQVVEIQEIKPVEVQEVKPTEQNGYLLSVIFAILFAFVGLIPAMIALLYAGYFVGILYMLSPMAAFFGYKLGKAPLNKVAYAVAFIASIIANAVVMLAVYNSLANMGGITFEEITTNPEYGFVSDFAMSFVFLGIGILLSVSFISKRLKSNEK